ncbi:MAG: hypothetical protein N2235_15345 [Fischerella sp.]|nr:hypothetical protein [Fischerella sp.]
MNHFNFKSLTFYSVAICSVLLLFKTVTAYGEKNLKAPPPINGNYHLVFRDKLPKCNQVDAVTLNIQQSGIYLNGLLLPANVNAGKTSTATENLNLTGTYKNQKLNLSGRIPSFLLACNIVDLQTQVRNRFQKNSDQKFISLQMQLINKQEFTGQITVNGIPKIIAFTAVPQKTQKQSENSKSY